MIIEEFDFYQRLSPKARTDLIHFLFHDFKRQFSHFFDSCENGFQNEVIIRLYARNLPPNIQLTRPGHKQEVLYFLKKGFVSLSSPKSFTPFLVLPTSAVVGDYQILFDLVSNISVKVYVPPEFMAQHLQGHGEKDLDQEENKKKSKDSPQDQ